MMGVEVFFKKFLMPCGLCAAVPVMKPAPPSPDCSVPCNTSLEYKKLIRPSELPIYSVENTCSKPIPCPDDNCAPSYLEQGFGTIRKTVQGVLFEYSYISNSVSAKIDTGLEHSQFLLDYLKEESNLLPRLGAIGIGGLTGLILGLRGGTFKRLVYSSTGALGVAAICYPKQAREGVSLAKHYVNVGYNFVYGVKPDDADQFKIVWPELPKLKMPSSLSEFVDLAVETGSAAGTTIGSLFSKSSENSQENKEEKSPEDSPKSKES